MSRSKDQDKMVARLWSRDLSSQLESTIKIKNILSKKRTPPPIDEMTLCMALIRFMEFLKKQYSPKLQFEAACALTNIACENANVVINQRAVPFLVELLASSPNDGVREQVIFALGNVACNSIQCRDHVLSCKALMPLLPQLNEDTKLSMRRAATWTLHTLCRDKPPLPFDQVKLVVAALEQVLRTNDEELLRHACWALFDLSYGSKDGIQSVVEAGFVPRLVQLLQYNSLIVVVPALRTIGNIVTGDSQKTQCVISNGALPILANMLNQDYDIKVKKDACWTISNITAGTVGQIQSVINENLIPTLVNLAQNADFGTKIEALWAILNATSFGSHDQIKYLVGNCCIKPLCDNLLCPRVILACLNGLENILKVGEAEKKTGDHVNYYRQLIIDAQGHEKIKNLQSHGHNDIKEKAVKILETYWPEEENVKTLLCLQPPM